MQTIASFQNEKEEAKRFPLSFEAWRRTAISIPVSQSRCWNYSL